MGIEKEQEQEQQQQHAHPVPGCGSLFSVRDHKEVIVRLVVGQPVDPRAP